MALRGHSLADLQSQNLPITPPVRGHRLDMPHPDTHLCPAAGAEPREGGAGPADMQRPISAGPLDPRRCLLRAASSEAAQLKAKGRCLGIPSLPCAPCTVGPGKASPLCGPQFLVCERSCLGSTTLWTWVPCEPKDPDSPSVLFSVASAPTPGSSSKIFKET